jgi:3-hydroxyisobutyrate dehydrogenase-like beta-hydroxyacid dehydrogenase
MDVGFIGLGQMGSGMALNLAKAGHNETVYNRSPEKMEPLVQAGARPAKSVADACRGEVVFTMLADDAAVEAVTFGDDGILASLSKGATHISSSTISTALSERLTQAHADAGQNFLAAPVFGRPDAARAGKLFIIVAGAADTIEKMSPLFDVIGQRTFTVSDTPKNANLVKLSGKVLTSTLFGAPVYKTYGGLIADEQFEPPGFAAPLGLKDVRLALTAGEELRVPLPFASLVRDRFITLLAHGGDKLDWAAVGSVAAWEAGAGSLKTSSG